MADNITITQGSGTDIAADEIGGIKFQRVKLIHGADGVNDGDISSANPLPVTGTVSGITNTVAVYFSPANPAVNTTLTGSMAVYYQPSEPTIKGITNTVGVYLSATAGTIRVGDIPGTMAVYFSPANPSVSTTLSGTMAVYFDQSNPAVTGYGLDGAAKRPLRMNSDGAIKVYDLVGGTVTIQEPLSIDDNGGSLTIDGTVTANAGSGTMAVYFSGSEPTIKIKDTYHTSIISGNVSSSYAGVSDLGVTLVAAEAGHAIKVYALQLTTTAQIQTVVQFTNGAGAATEYWRYALQAPTAGIAGANLAISPPGYLFATAAGSTLALVTKNASLIHYSIAYFKESA